MRATVLIAAGLSAFALGSSAQASTPAANVVQQENAKPGSTGWLAPLAPEPAIEGYASEPGAVAGDRLHFHVSTRPAARYRIVIYRLGWYSGAGSRLIACLPDCTGDEPGVAQPLPAIPGAGDSPVLSANWSVTDSIVVSPDWVSGYYEVQFLLTSGPDAGKTADTWVIVRTPPAAPSSQILVQVPVNTWQAYNQWGGKSLYDFAPHGYAATQCPGCNQARAYRVSFERPYGPMANSPMWWEIQLVRFLERKGYDVSYQTDLDTDSNPTSLLRHQLVMVAGHDEYWTMGIRTAFDTAVARGTNLAFMGSNDAYWRVKYQDNDQTIFAYKSLYDPTPVTADKTAMFREIGMPECELMAVQTIFFAVLRHELDYTVTAAGAADPWLRGTGLKAGDTIAGVVGREHDVLNPYPAPCFHPGLVDLFHYDGSAEKDQNGDAVKFTAPSGARIFASGAQQFSWALDSLRADGVESAGLPIDPGGTVAVDPRLQTFVRNMINDLTRPAPPSGLTVSLNGNTVQVSTQPSDDPRVRQFIAARRNGKGGWARLCHGATTCTVPLRRPPKRPVQVVVGAVAINAWGRTSSPTYWQGPLG